MEIKLTIPDDKISHFTESAKARLEKSSKEYIEEIISEAEKIEKTNCEKGASAEITDTFVFLAVKNYRTKRKKKTGFIITRIIAEVFLFFSGILFIPEKFVTDSKLNISYFVFFAVISLIAIGATIISHFGGDE